MRFTSIIATTAFLAQAIAVNVACLVRGVQVAIVDLDTGNCPFTIPSGLPILFDFVSPQDFDIVFYYSLAAGERFFNDIVNAGDVITIPANLLFNLPGAPLYQVSVQQEPSVNSTEAVRKRLWKETVIAKRDAASDFADSLKGLDGTLVDPGAFSVVLADQPTSTPTTSPTGATTTAISTVVTVVTCTETVCKPTTVPAKPTVTTATISEVVTVFTTYCPESSITVPTFTVTLTKSDTVTTCPATPALTTITSAGKTTVVVTTVPITETVSKPTGAPTATTPGAPTVTPAPSPATATTKPAVPTFEAGAAAAGSSFLALAMIPLAYLI
ncbi:uncharacterized protein SPAPADRAFT_62499 [Spathaspora passalidarum NRRL Y-27907]|uniref:Uncharacterized protein n=1 Tax=Spathaspora passalidarum (strain NRRL Y-27907 / 11-Y1) TaxID=619300 RepID=G3AS99_SPAPN|nr:uncharacterized protein SPAPADRAFT_62499 [Spathaspora passalidarum NRRL Y-27907]EGW30639.1 hypothetical protein SPAPADRAFT_62499 [Spathaspora passalidarum NRRL Y-27907]